MLKRHFYYYVLKPYLPRPLRMAMRRVVVRWKRRKYQATWPISQTASRKPAGWPGWPEGKEFALVLTHDVEGPEGLALVRSLAELEMSLGFRSSFNFIPEGTYTVPAELRAWLLANGFEVGVHDLKHDGKLYVNQTQFRRHARQINGYLAGWKAVGFRSGFMHHHQEWLHDLNVQYDASTFDTDPFEPQPDGVNTIFPFWVPTPRGSPRDHGGTRFLAGDDDRDEAEPPGSSLPSSALNLPAVSLSNSPNGAKDGPLSPSLPQSLPPSPKEGYVELPYTLPQDSTLFLLLEEKTGDIWKLKLDWVARHGGMALINVHPDYLPMNAGTPGSTPTVREHYADWLRTMANTYGGSYWHVLPRDMAAFVLKLKNRLPHPPSPVP